MTVIGYCESCRCECSFYGLVAFVNFLAPVSDQNRISPYNFNITSCRQLMRIRKKYKSGDYKLIQYQILQTYIIRIAGQTVRRTANDNLGVKGLSV